MVNEEEALGIPRDTPLPSNLTCWVELTFIDNTVFVLIVLVELHMATVDRSVDLELADLILAISIDLMVLNLKFLEDHCMIRATLLVKASPNVPLALSFAVMSR